MAEGAETLLGPKWEGEKQAPFSSSSLQKRVARPNPRHGGTALGKCWPGRCVWRRESPPTHPRDVNRGRKRSGLEQQAMLVSDSPQMISRLRWKISRLPERITSKRRVLGLGDIPHAEGPKECT